ncbi:uncharacterized protein LOC141718744 [Apium graveolens]|uniref:uncharacterized protein LOC141718744 n=1 Tax=Apium graveolens TaxID=4045 RepID=UPI003D7AB226
MEKDWISKERDSLKYDVGVEKFFIYAEENCKNPKKIPCPYCKCVNFKKFPIKVIRGHLYEYGFSLGYIDWIWHRSKTGRSSVGSTVPHHEEKQNADAFKSAFEAASEVAAASEAAAAGASQATVVCEAAYRNPGGKSGGDDYDKDSHDFKRFVADAQQPLFEGSDYTKLDSDNALPVNAYEAKKTLSNLGLEYTKFHACPNECVLYRGVNETASECPKCKCPKCKLSRWKVGKDGRERYKIPAKVMWYFPIIPRFKWMFKSSSTAELLTWHSNQRIHDGQMCHPADSPSWRNIDYRWPAFGSEPRNLRLALSADGINPHNNGLSNRYSCWPIVLVTYNLPPWLCMKRKFMMLTILVSGPHEPGNNLDVFLQPLVDDLKKFWEEGEPNVYDGLTKTFFTLRATFLWTINDFPAYGNLSGCVNKGYLGCPVCGDDTIANYLPYSRKICYQGHRWYLPRHHPYRKKKAAFNGQQEFGQPRQPLFGQEVLAQ